MTYDNVTEEELNDYGIEKKEQLKKCFVCGSETFFFDTYFHVPSCRPKCSREISREIFNEVKRLTSAVTRLEERINKFIK